MPKEGSSEASRDGKQGVAAVTEEKKLPSSAKKTNDEIDEIFASKKRVKGDRVKSDKRGDALSVGAKKMKKKNIKGRGEGDNVNGVASEWSSRPRKRTGDGLAVYTEDELGTNKEDAGSTPLCPFDCSCCF